MDPADPTDIETQSVIDLAFSLGASANIGAAHTTYEGYGYGDGGYLSEWANVQGIAGSTPGTLEYFWIRFGLVIVDDNTGAAEWQKGEFTLTVATTGESRS